ncbi:MAG: YggT family protein [Anaerolineae bacterium]
MSAIIGMLMRAVDIFFGVVGLLLLLRVLLQVFNMRRNHPVLQVIARLTDPILVVTNRLLGLASYRQSYSTYPGTRSDMMSSLAALVVLWALRTVIAWGLRLFVLVPVWAASPLASIESILVYFLRIFFDLYGLALLVRVLFSWLRVPYSSKLMRFLWNITEPLLAPLRSALPPLGGIDLSPLIAFFLLRLLERVVFSFISWIF